MWKTIMHLKAANAAKGGKFFSPENMRFMNSRIVSSLYAGKYFITSEKTRPERPEKFTVRAADCEANIKTASEFMEFDYIEFAREFLRELLRKDKEEEKKHNAE